MVPKYLMHILLAVLMKESNRLYEICRRSTRDSLLVETLSVSFSFSLSYGNFPRSQLLPRYISTIFTTL